MLALAVASDSVLDIISERVLRMRVVFFWNNSLSVRYWRSYFSYWSNSQWSCGVTNSSSVGGSYESGEEDELQ